MLKYALFFVLMVLLSFGGFVAYHVGATKPVDITEEDRPEMHGLYMDHVGPYHKTVSAIEKVENWAQENKIDCRLSYGEYLENPEQVEEARLKSRGGCLVDRLPGEFPKDFQTINYPARHYVVAKFEGSPGIGPLKVYPKVAKYMESKYLEQKGPVMEVYEIHSRTEKTSMTTTYLFPVAKKVEALQIRLPPSGPPQPPQTPNTGPKTK